MKTLVRAEQKIRKDLKWRLLNYFRTKNKNSLKV